MTKPQMIDAKEPVSKALAMVSASGLSVLVFDGKKYVGMIDERAVQSHATNPSKMHISKLAVKTPVLKPNSSLAEICSAFFAGRFKSLPVMDKDKCVGMFNRWELLQALGDEGQLTGHRVLEYMTSPILTIDANAPVSTAHTLMRQANVRRLAVLQNGRLVGLVSVFDLLKTRNAPRGRQPEMKQYPKDESAPVSSYMKSEVHTISPDEGLVKAAEQMLDQQVAALIVTDGSRPVGILTVKDILQAVMRKDTHMPVFVSGLHNMDKSVASDLMVEGQNLLDKLGASIGAQAMSIHVKEDGKEFRVSAHVQGDHLLRASASGWTLMEAVRNVMAELKTQALRAKKTGMSRRDNL